MGFRARTNAALAACVFGLAFGLAGGCLLELDRSLACGDGLVDVLAGEQCDPNDLNSPHLTYCLDKGLGQGQATCDSDCQIQADKDMCAACGDGIAAGAEQCDGDDLRGAVCPSGQGQLGCKPPDPDVPQNGCLFDISGCDPCGDGKHSSEVEECDFSTQCTQDADCGEEMVCDTDKKTCVQPGEIGVGVQCSGLVGPKGLYSKGVVNNAECTKDCRYDRHRCNYCGDGQLDAPYEDYTSLGTFLQEGEVCDGDDADPEALVEYCQELCTGGPNNTTLQLRCEFKCDDGCREFVAQSWEDPIQESARCCVMGGEPCDGPGGFPCCYALDNPEDADNACLTNTLPKPLCRSG